MCNKLSLLALALALALTGCAAQQSAISTPSTAADNTTSVQEKTPGNIIERSLDEGLYEMASGSAAENVLYVASAGNFKNIQGGMVYKLNASTLETVSATHTNMKNFGMAISADGKTVYISNTTDGGISAIDTTDGKVKKTLIFSDRNKKGHPDGPRQIVLHGNTLYVGAVADPGYIWVVDADTLKLKTRIKNAGKWVTGLYYSAQTDRLYATNGSDELMVINLRNNRIEKRWKPLGDKPTFYMNIAEDPQRGRLFVTDNGKAKTTLVVDIHNGELIKQLDVGDSLGVIFNPKRDELYISQRMSGKVLSLDGSSYAIKHSWDLPPNPNSLAVSADGNTLYVTVKQPFSKDNSVTKPDSVVRIDLTK